MKSRAISRFVGASGPVQDGRRFADNIFNTWIKIIVIWVKFHLAFLANDLIDDLSLLFVAKSLPEPIMTNFID